MAEQIASRLQIRMGRRAFLGCVGATVALGGLCTGRASAAQPSGPWELPEPSPENSFLLLPLADDFASGPAEQFRSEMAKMIEQFGGQNLYQRLGFSFIPRGRDQLMSAAQAASDLGVYIGVIMPYQYHSSGAQVTTDLRTYQWRMNGDWAGPTSDARDHNVPSPSRYNTATRDLLVPVVNDWANDLLDTMAAYPGVVSVINAVIEEELAIGGQDIQYLADYSPFAIAEFRDWLTHRGEYDADTGRYAGQGAPEEIVGKYMNYNGRLRSPFYADKSPSAVQSGRPSFNAWFGTNFSTWTLRYWDLDQYPDPIPIPGTQGWQPGSNVASVTVVDSFAEGPGTPHGGKSCLQATCPGASADASRVISVAPPSPLDLSAAQSLTVWMDSYGGAPGATGYEASVTVFAGDTQRNVVDSTFEPNQWNSLTVDLSGWTQRSGVTRIEVAFRALGSTANWGPVFHIDDITASGVTMYDFEPGSFSTMPESGAGFTSGGFDAPRALDPTSRFWNAWSWDYPDHDNAYPPGNPENPAFGFRQNEVHHVVIDMFDLLATAGLPRVLMYPHQIPGEVVSGDGMGAGAPRCRSSASPAWTGLLPLNGNLGITRFGPIDPKLVLQYSDNWGIFEWHPDPGAAPDSKDLYTAATNDLNTYFTNRAHALFPGWWDPNGAINTTFPLNDSMFATAIRDFLDAAPDVPYSMAGTPPTRFTPPPVHDLAVAAGSASTAVLSWSPQIWSGLADPWQVWREFAAFEVQSRVGSTPWQPSATVQTTTVTFSGRDPKVSYKYRVRARTKAGLTGPWVQVTG